MHKKDGTFTELYPIDILFT